METMHFNSASNKNWLAGFVTSPVEPRPTSSGCASGPCSARTQMAAAARLGSGSSRVSSPGAQASATLKQRRSSNGWRDLALVDVDVRS